MRRRAVGTARTAARSSCCRAIVVVLLLGCCCPQASAGGGAGNATANTGEPPACRGHTLLGVWTSKKTRERRAPVLATWFVKGCVVWLSCCELTAADGVDPADVVVTGGPDTYVGVTYRGLRGLALMRGQFPDFAWYGILGDDNYVHWPALLAGLDGLGPRRIIAGDVAAASSTEPLTASSSSTRIPIVAGQRSLVAAHPTPKGGLAARGPRVPRGGRGNSHQQKARGSPTPRRTTTRGTVLQGAAPAAGAAPAGGSGGYRFLGGAGIFHNAAFVDALRPHLERAAAASLASPEVHDVYFSRVVRELAPTLPGFPRPRSDAAGGLELFTHAGFAFSSEPSLYVCGPERAASRRWAAVPPATFHRFRSATDMARVHAIATTGALPPGTSRDADGIIKRTRFLRHTRCSVGQIADALCRAWRTCDNATTVATTTTR